MLELVVQDADSTRPSKRLPIIFRMMTKQVARKQLLRWPKPTKEAQIEFREYVHYNMLYEGFCRFLER
jgi:hypothetical protein